MQPGKPLILFEDEHIIVCVKPAGVASQGAKSFQADMTDLLRRHIMTSSKEKKIPEIYVIHRLDQPVGGVMVYAKTKAAASALSRQTSEHTMSKSYYAVAHGDIASDGVLTDYLLKDGKTNTSSVVPENTAGAKKASLEYTVLNRALMDGEPLSLVKVTLHTGRHHQIRVQFAHAGHPLFGDQKYSPKENLTKGTSTLGLFSCSLEFVHPATKKRMTFEYSPEYAPFTEF